MSASAKPRIELGAVLHRETQMIYMDMGIATWFEKQEMIRKMGEAGLFGEVEVDEVQEHQPDYFVETFRNKISG